MTLKERQRLLIDIHTRIMFLHSDLSPSAVRLEVEYGIMPLIENAFDKRVWRRDG